MRINGEWLVCLDGDTRPVIRAEILLDDGTWLEIRLLLDTGADCTVFSSDVLAASRLQSLAGRSQIGGVGGVVDTKIVRTQIRFRCDDSVLVVFRGDYAAFSQPDVLDMSVLGRDILDSFAIIVDRPANIVAILGGNHLYTIHHRV